LTDEPATATLDVKIAPEHPESLGPKRRNAMLPVGLAPEMLTLAKTCRPTVVEPDAVMLN
jgi:hypothetical protein